MSKKWTEMSLDELETLANELDEKRLAVRDEMRALRRVIDAKLAAQSAADKLARMSDAERMALLQMIEEAGSIESAVKMGDLGTVAVEQ